MDQKEFIFQHQFDSFDQALDFLLKSRRHLGETSRIRLENKELTITDCRDLGLGFDLKKRPQYETLALYCDGGSRGNPGPGAAGVLVIDVLTDKYLLKKGRYFEFCTNNYAEAQSLNLGLKLILKNFKIKKTLKIYMDSQLIVKQVRKDYKIKNPDLKVVHQEIQASLKLFPNYQIIHIPRALNQPADAVVNLVLDQRKDI